MFSMFRSLLVLLKKSGWKNVRIVIYERHDDGVERIRDVLEFEGIPLTKKNHVYSYVMDILEHELLRTSSVEFEPIPNNPNDKRGKIKWTL